MLLRVGSTAFVEGLSCRLLAIGIEHLADFGARGARGLLKVKGKRFVCYRFLRSRRLLRRLSRASAVKSPLIKAAVKAEVPRGSSMLKVKSYVATS